MRRRLLLSSMLLIGVSVISIAAFASSCREVPVHKVRLHYGQPDEQVYVFSEEEVQEPDQPAIEEDTCFLTRDERHMLAKLAMAEAEGEDTVGKAHVIRVVLNRVESNSFPDSIEEVVFQKKQFSSILDGRYERVEPNEDCWKALDMVVQEGWDESQGALYFEASSGSTWHMDNLQYLFTHENHMFYTERN